MTRVFQFIFGVVFAVCLGMHPAIAVERPFDLTGTGTLEVMTDDNGQLTHGVLNASGTATHLGKWTQTGNLIFTPDQSNPDIILASGDTKFIGANGDELQAEIKDSVLDTTTGIATGTFLFVGGTRRFDQAQGSADFTVTQELNSGTFDVVAQGRIDY
ncbi:MAG: hypothetical protein RIM23_04605 [Coleofasciculus sp. G3-WIS-01]|uniref:hypothetical protein n=1 Tax=Coleofasciculus sp. G3-WIS-01 TaxID=3069528 RepID=UPI003300E2F4